MVDKTIDKYRKGSNDRMIDQMLDRTTKLDKMIDSPVLNLSWDTHMNDSSNHAVTGFMIWLKKKNLFWPERNKEIN